MRIYLLLYHIPHMYLSLTVLLAKQHSMEDQNFHFVLQLSDSNYSKLERNKYSFNLQHEWFHLIGYFLQKYMEATFFTQRQYITPVPILGTIEWSFKTEGELASLLHKCFNTCLPTFLRVVSLHFLHLILEYHYYHLQSIIEKCSFFKSCTEFTS